MSSVRRRLVRLLFWVAALIATIALVVGGGVLYSNQFKRTPPFLDDHGNVLAGSVATFEDIRLGGYEQAVLIRGRNAHNPLLLYLHGGPGSPELALVRRFNSVLEDHYTVVVWEQRGSGKSYSPFLDDSSMTIERLLGDAHELMIHLTQRFHQEKLYLVGHSFGSFLGLELARRYPHLLRAYVGLGQVVSWSEGERLSMEFALERARATHNQQALAELGAIRAFPSAQGDWQRELATERKWVGRFGGILYGKDGMSSLFFIDRPDEFTLFDFVTFGLGSLYSIRALWPALQRTDDFRRTATKLEIPVYFFTGRHDYTVPAELSREYFDRLQAPKKEWVWFEASAHMPNFEEPAHYNALMVEKVLAETLPKAGVFSPR
jgi:pimeloyl-ACP methyl ester carboxylesterase